MDELNRTLDNLEAHFNSMSGGRSKPPSASSRDNVMRRMERLSNDTALRPRDRNGIRHDRQPQRRRPAEKHPFQSLARDIERTRQQDEGVAAVSKIAAELRELREEMRHEMTAGLHREFETLRRDIETAYANTPNGAQGTELKRELDRISGAVRDLAQRSDDTGIDLLRGELEEVKQSIGSLAREDTLRSVDSQWNEFGRRWDAFEERVSARPESLGADPALNALYERLDEISDAVQDLPESLSLRSIEEKVRTIAGSLDRFSEPQNTVSPETFGTIEQRLDEISRAIVASSVVSQPTGTVNQEALERIEAGMSSLVGQLETLDADRPAFFEGLSELSRRVEEIAERAEAPGHAVENLATQIGAISERLADQPDRFDGDAVVRTLEDRLYVMSEKIDQKQGETNDRNEGLFRELETQLAALSVRLDEREAEPAVIEKSLMEAIDERFSAFASRLEEGGGRADPEAMQKLESRLETISTQLDSSAQQIAGVDPELIRSLEEQVSDLSTHLAQPAGPVPELQNIQPRLDSIEQSIAGSREGVMEAARRAAEEAVKNVTTSDGEGAAATQLADDLKTLETLARKSDERNTRTFEAIHDTLLKIVDRLGSLEQGQPAAYAAPGPVEEKIGLPETPSTDSYQEPEPPVSDETPVDGDLQAGPRFDEPAIEVDQGGNGDGDSDERKSLFSGLTRALGKKKSADEPVEPRLAGDEPVMPKAEFDPEPDEDEANRPLEPGSGAPDLQEIMKRVRKERTQPAKPTESNASQSDFIAAARRAAQAAAAEAEVLKKKSESEGESGRFQAREFLKLKRKPILMAAAAIMIALAGLQLGKAFIGDDSNVALVGADPAPVMGEQVEQADPIADPADDVVMDAPDDPVISQPVDPVRVVENEDEQDDLLPEPAFQSGTAEVSSPVIASADVTAAPPASAPTEATPEPVQAGGFVEPPVEAGPVPLREAAAAGNAKAMFEIAARYAAGRGVEPDMAAAAIWYERAADLGFAPAQYRIGNFNEKGIGVARDVEKAKTWYQLAAEQGNASAMHNLAVLYAMGAEGTVDNESAVRWFVEAAERGIKDSQFNLGILAAKGVGMKQDLSESYKWFALAAKAGDKDAAAKRDEIAQALGTEQLARARAATELWKPKPVDPAVNAVDIPDEWTESEGRTASIDMKKAVANIQMILNKNGFDAGTPDGIMGAKTKSAIAEFQKANGLEPTGEVDEKLVRALLAKR